ncbi:hypothetical protein TNCV_4948011 [Trichonephila clavipes]|nr:hypothetical protein TNCV_4948011 [Trichonephila clavipes]
MEGQGHEITPHSFVKGHNTEVQVGWFGISIVRTQIIRNGPLTGRRMTMPNHIELVWWRKNGMASVPPESNRACLGQNCCVTKAAC